MIYLEDGWVSFIQIVLIVALQLSLLIYTTLITIPLPPKLFDRTRLILLRNRGTTIDTVLISETKSPDFEE